jgi:hypothetical protein
LAIAADDEGKVKKLKSNLSVVVFQRLIRSAPALVSATFAALPSMRSSRSIHSALSVPFTRADMILNDRIDGLM